MWLYFGILALFLTPPGLPSGGFHWQRTITPPPGAPLAQACVVLDAQTFANAAPALRDLRLFQNGVELPYAVEESFDPRSLESGVTTADDRSLYEPVLIANLIPRPPAAVAGDGLFRNCRTNQPLKPNEADPCVGTYQVSELPAHVPVERLRFEPAPTATAQVQVIATEQGGRKQPAPAEALVGTIDAQHPVFPLTIGANLQHAAELFVAIGQSDRAYQRAIFEMRRRSLCYQPQSASPLTLYLGGGEAMTAKTYSYASNFSTALDRPYATVGPLVPNTENSTAPVVGTLFTARRRMLLAAALAAGFFLVAARGMLRSTKSPA